jgi:ABC-type transport system involved in multi-copper enzyme maturation permease subunit
MSGASRLASGLSALALDNAVARKDALVLARQRGVLVALGLALVAALVTTAAVALAMVAAVDATSYGNVLFPHGRTLTASITGVALSLASLLVPSLASMSLAPERESGTLRLLLTTALTPDAIVLGKLLGVLHGVAAPLLLVLPLLAGGALFGAVSLADVLFCAALLVVNVIALAAVGVASSATSERVRVAPGKALACAMLFVWGPIGLPSMVLVVAWAVEGYLFEMIPGAALIACWAAVVVAGSFLIARDAVAPSTAPSRRARRRLVALALVVAPLLAAASLVGLQAPVDVEVWSSLYLLGFGVLSLTVVVGDVALSGRGDGGAFRSAARAAWLSSAGALLALPVVPLALEGVTTSGGPLRADPRTLLGATAPVALWLVVAALLTAVSAGRVSSPLRRAVTTVALLAGLWFVPAIIGSLPGLSGSVPLVDPANLIEVATGGTVGPLDAPWGANYGWPSLTVMVFVAWALALVAVSAGAAREKLRSRR